MSTDGTIDDIDEGGKFEYRWRVSHPVDRDALTVMLVRYDYDARRMWYAVLDDDGLHWVEYEGGWVISPLLVIDAISLREDTMREEAERFAQLVREAMEIKS